MNDVPICAQCRYYIPAGVRRVKPLCSRPTTTIYDVVEGERASFSSRSCYSERKRTETLFLRQPLCGPDGRFFKPHEQHKVV